MHTISGRLPGLDRAMPSGFPVFSDRTTLEIHTLHPEISEGELPEGFVRYGSIETLGAYYFAVEGVHAETDGADASIIGTSQDPGLVEAPSLVGLPVVSYREICSPRVPPDVENLGRDGETVPGGGRRQGHPTGRAAHATDDRLL